MGRAQHMARRRAVGWSSARRTQDATRRRIHKDSRHRVPGVATVRRRNKSGTGRRPFMGNNDTPMLDGSKARTQTSLWEGNGAREGEATVLTAGRRFGRCRLVEDGGATWTYAAAPGSLLCFGVSSRHERSPSFRRDPSISSWPRAASGSSASAAMRRKAPASPPPLLPLFPLLSSPRRCSLERGKTPTGPACERGRDPRVVGLDQGAEGRKAASRAPIGGSSLDGDVAGYQWWSPALWRHRQGAIGGNHPRGTPGPGHGRARELGGPDIPSRARGRGVVRCWGGAMLVREEKVRLVEKGRPTSGSHLPEIERMSGNGAG
jgi:hypothetical protein